MFTIPQPPWTSLGKTLESKVRKSLHTFRLLENSEKLAVALSGGKDSLTLLFLLHAILGKGTKPVSLIAIHVEGEFSCGSSLGTKWLQEICTKLKIPFYVQKSSITKEKLRCYSCSRERRKLLFTKAVSEGCSHIAFGHHQDDANQTLLLNLLHKGEFASMLPKVPMEKYGITIIRPLFFVLEQEIVRFAKQHHFQRISCGCPVGQTSQRAKTKDLIAYMQQVFPNTSTNLFSAGMEYGSKKALQP